MIRIRSLKRRRRKEEEEMKEDPNLVPMGGSNV
jgi:hypothetical protein